MDLGIKTSIGIFSFVTLLGSASQASEVFYATGFCEPSSLTLQVKNTSKEAQHLWTQVRYNDELVERSFEVSAQGQVVIEGSQFLTEKNGFSLKAWNKKTLQMTLKCSDRGHVTLTDLSTPEVSHWLPTPAKSIKLHVMNLFLKSNSVKLKAFNAKGSLVEEKELRIESYYDTESLKWTFTEPVSRIDVQGQERLSSVLFFDSGSEEKSAPGFSLKPATLPVDSSKTYFLVSTKEARPEESFVIALTESAQIATAREQIKNKNLEKIVVAGIELGHGGFNRSFSSRDKAPYSWSVNRVDAFADFAHIDCDGSPELTEERLLQKLNEGGRICFWRYRVVRELTPQEVSSGALKP